MRNSERREISRMNNVISFIDECKGINIELSIVKDDINIKEKFNKKYNDDNFKIVKKSEWRLFLENINEFSKIYIFLK